MRTNFRATALLVGILTACSLWTRAQVSQPGERFHLSSTEVAVTFTTEQSKTTANGDNTFWFRGGSVEPATTFFHGLGAAADLTLEEADNVAPSVNLSKIAFMAGPRYTFRIKTKPENRLFVESLFGVTSLHDGVIPTSTGVTGRANSFSFQLGGGWDVAITKAIALRLIEAAYVRSTLPNGAGNVQDHLQLDFGVVYHF